MSELAGWLLHLGSEKARICLLTIGNSMASFFTLLRNRLANLIAVPETPTDGSAQSPTANAKPAAAEPAGVAPATAEPAGVAPATAEPPLSPTILRFCAVCGSMPPSDPIVGAHHLRFCAPRSPNIRNRGDAEHLRIELDALDAIYLQVQADSVVKKGHMRAIGRPTYFRMVDMRLSDRAELLAELQLRYSNRLIAEELGGVSEGILRVWSLVLLVIPEVREALELGEAKGLSLKDVKRFFYIGRGPYQKGKPLPRPQQLELLEKLRGTGRQGKSRGIRKPGPRLKRAGR